MLIELDLIKSKAIFAFFIAKLYYCQFDDTIMKIIVAILKPQHRCDDYCYQFVCGVVAIVIIDSIVVMIVFINFL